MILLSVSFVQLYIYVLGCKLSVVRLCDSDCGITAVDDITVGITCVAFCLHIAHISFASSWCTCFVCRLLFIIIIIIITAIELSLGSSRPYTSTDKTNKNIQTVQTIQNKVEGAEEAIRRSF